MSSKPNEMSPMSLARTAGILYLLLALVGPFSLMVIPSQVIVPGDAAATANNILEHESLFRLGFLGDSAIVLIEIVLVAVLYVLLRPVNRTLSLAAALARLTMVVLQGMNMLPNFAALHLLRDSEALVAFTPEQLNLLVQQVLALRGFGAMIWELFFGFHLALLGYLFYKSAYIPRVISVLVMLASVSYLLQSLGMMLAPSGEATYQLLVTIFSIVGELSLTFWLLIKGVRIPTSGD